MEHITFEDYTKVQIFGGKIVAASKVDGKDKLLRLLVDFGVEIGPKVVVSGIAEAYPNPTHLIGTITMFVLNLEPRKVAGIESQAMIFGGTFPFDKTFALIQLDGRLIGQRIG